MNLLLVEVICPSTSRSYDYRIPPKMKSGDVKRRIISDIRQFEGMSDLFPDENNVSLYRNEHCINDENTLYDAGIKSGDSLMLV